MKLKRNTHIVNGRQIKRIHIHPDNKNYLETRVSRETVSFSPLQKDCSLSTHRCFPVKILIEVCSIAEAKVNVRTLSQTRVHALQKRTATILCPATYRDLTNCHELRDKRWWQRNVDT